LSPAGDNRSVKVIEGSLKLRGLLKVAESRREIGHELAKYRD
jgi:hypothetical protein